MGKVNFNDLGMTEVQLIEKYSKEKTKLILSSRFFDCATVILNDEGESVYSFTNINQVLRELDSIKSNYWD